MSHEDKKAPAKEDAPKAKRIFIPEDDPPQAVQDFRAYLEAGGETPDQWWSRIFVEIEKQKEGL